MTRFESLIALGSTCSLLAGCISGDVAIFLPVTTDAYQLPQNRIPQDLIEERTLTAADGVRLAALAAWQREPSLHPSVLFLHGQGGNLDDCWAQVMTLWEHGFNVYAVDYRGYGKSNGKPSEAGLYLDAAAAYADLINSGRIDTRRLLLWGFSLGTGVASELATHAMAQALALESPFTSMTAMVERSGPYSLPADWFTHVRMDTLGRIDQIDMPLLVAHGTADQRIPLWMGEKVYAAAKDPKDIVRVEGATHGYALRQGARAIFASLSELAPSLATP